MLESDDVAVRLVIGGGEMTIHGQFETMLSAIVDDISHDEPPMATGSNQRPAHHVRSSWLRCIYNSSCDLLVRSRCDLSVRSLGAISASNFRAVRTLRGLAACRRMAINRDARCSRRV